MREKPIEDRVAEQVTRLDEIAEKVASREALLARLEILEQRLAIIEPDLKWLHEERQKARR